MNLINKYKDDFKILKGILLNAKSESELVQNNLSEIFDKVNSSYFKLEQSGQLFEDINHINIHRQLLDDIEVLCCSIDKQLPCKEISLDKIKSQISKINL